MDSSDTGYTVSYIYIYRAVVPSRRPDKGTQTQWVAAASWVTEGKIIQSKTAAMPVM